MSRKHDSKSSFLYLRPIKKLCPSFPVFPKFPLSPVSTVFLAFPVPVSLWTDAAVAVQMVDALSSVLTAMINTLVIIYTAVWPHPAGDTHTPATHKHKHIQDYLTHGAGF